MLEEISFHERLLECLPQLLKNSRFMKEVRTDLGTPGTDLLERAKNRNLLDDEDRETLSDPVYNAYMECATPVLTLAWDDDASGMSGAIWLHNCEEIYVITSSDYDDVGPFLSLKEALQEECFNTVTANPELDSETLPTERLLEIAGQVVDWENEGTIEINSETYRASGDALVLDS